MIGSRTDGVLEVDALLLGQLWIGRASRWYAVQSPV
jgi:hypothetical protein